MKIKYFLIIEALVLLVFAVGYCVNAAWVLGLFNISLEPGGILIAQLFSPAIMGIAALNWLMRKVHYFKLEFVCEG